MKFLYISNIVKRLKWMFISKLGFKKVLITNKLGFKLLINLTNLSAPFFYFDKYEKEETDLMTSLIKPGMTVFDIGANIGYFTLLMASLVGNNGQVHVFESNPDVLIELIKNIDINPELSDGRIKIKQEALGDVKGQKTFYCPIEGHHGVGGLKNTKRAPLKRTITVKVNTLDNYIKMNNIKKIDFIKMDIEGGELDVFKGAEYTLNKNQANYPF